MRATWIALGISLGLISCTTEEQMPQVGELEQGVTILDSDPARGVVAAYREGDDVIYLETRVGALKPSIYRESEPGEPANEVDMMIVDAHGMPFYIQRGGDAYVDPTWDAKIAIAKATPVLSEERNRDFRMAQKMGRLFPQVADKSLAVSTYHVEMMGRQVVPMEDAGAQAALTKIKNTPLPNGESAYGTWYGSGWYYPLGRLYEKCVALCVGHHSAVSNWQWNGSAWQTIENYCNHGTCAGNMSWTCDKYSDWRLNPQVTGESNGNTSISGAGCTTRYDWWGGGGSHLCNDDSAYELSQIKEGTINTSLGGQSNYNWGNYSCNVGRGKWAVPGCGQ